MCVCSENTIFDYLSANFGASPVVLVVKNQLANAGDIGDEGSIPGLGKIPWRRAWESTPVFLPGESPWTEEAGGVYGP